jgi:3-methyl-2-oxobutanoate hydroxymethyltransferase
MGHIGLTPQSVNALGGFKVQGRNDGQKIIDDAKALEAAGCFAIVLELIPAELAQQISNAISIPTVGIGAGKDCDAQVLVWTDLMGLTPKAPRFARQYRNLREEMRTAVQEWIADVESGSFPNESETFH